MSDTAETEPETMDATDLSVAGLTWDKLARIMSSAMRSRGEWAGCPVPLPGQKLCVEDKYPYKALETMAFPVETAQPARKAIFTDDDESSNDTETLENFWYCRRRQRTVLVVHTGPPETRRAHSLLLKGTGEGKRLKLALDTLGTAAAWGLEAEAKAQERLSELITPHALRCYLLTGSFLETSKRSGVTYLFRRLRPTVAIKATQDGKDSRILAALCLHPIAYYERTYGGSMVPTDDVIAHLMLMRGDEPLYWRRANQHPPYMPEAGI